MSQLAELLATFPEPENPVTLDDLLKLINVGYVDVSSDEPLVEDQLNSERVSFLRLLKAMEVQDYSLEVEAAEQLNSERKSFLRLLKAKGVQDYSLEVKAAEQLDPERTFFLRLLSAKGQKKLLENVQTKILLPSRLLPTEISKEPDKLPRYQSPPEQEKPVTPESRGVAYSASIDHFRPKRKADGPRLKVIERQRPQPKQYTAEELANFTPYEVLQSELAFNLSCSASRIRFMADKKGLLYRWPGIGPERVYLMRNLWDEEAFGIKHRNQVRGGEFEGYAPHNLSKGKSILFPKRRFPYSMNGEDIISLERRLEIDKIEIATRAIETGDSMRGIEIKSRDDEIKFLYAKSQIPNAQDEDGKTKTSSHGKSPSREIVFKALEDYPVNKTIQDKDEEMQMRRNAYEQGIERAANKLANLPTFACLNEVEITEEDLKYLERARPVTRGDCSYVPRPCPFFLCPYNLTIDLDTGKITELERTKASGNVKVYDPDTSFLDQDHSCVLDVAEAGPLTLEQVGEDFHLTRERIRQIELKAKEHLRNRFPIILETSPDKIPNIFPDSDSGKYKQP